jgi:DNA-binding MarR family transcriptional regulator
MDIYDDFSACIYFHLTSAARNLDQLAGEAFAACGLSPSLAFLLLYLSETRGDNINNCAAFLHLAPSTLSRYADRLETKGLITKKNDGRIVTLVPTAEGMSLIPDIKKQWDKLYAKMVDRLGQDGYDSLLASLMVLE